MALSQARPQHAPLSQAEYANLRRRKVRAYENGKLYINKPRLGNKFFAAALCESALSFLIHEFAHEHAGDHLSHEYHEAACRLGARLVVAVANDPSLIEAPTTPL